MVQFTFCYDPSKKSTVKHMKILYLIANLADPSIVGIVKEIHCGCRDKINQHCITQTEVGINSVIKIGCRTTSRPAFKPNRTIWDFKPNTFSKGHEVFLTSSLFGHNLQSYDLSSPAIGFFIKLKPLK